MPGQCSKPPHLLHVLFFSCLIFFFNICEYINFPGFPALYSSSTQKQELEIQQNALWSTGPSVCLGGTYLIPSCKLQARNNMPGMWCLPDIPACTGITQCQNYSYSASLCFLSTNCQTCVFFPGYRGYGIGTGGLCVPQLVAAAGCFPPSCPSGALFVRIQGPEGEPFPCWELASASVGIQQHLAMSPSLPCPG